MENNRNYTYDDTVIQLDDEVAASRRFIANVFLWMFLALGISAFCAYLFAGTPGLLSLLIDLNTGHNTTLGTVLMFAPLAFILIMNFGINRISYPALVALFIAFAVCMGATLSFILLIYSGASLAGVFVTASALFGVMAVAGYTTHQDLTKFGSLMIMGLIGLVIASVVNIFIHSDQLSMLMSYVGVAVFIGLTAYKVQMLKRIGAGIEYGDASGKKLALMGALSLYMTFINLFLSLLRIFGRRR